MYVVVFDPAPTVAVTTDNTAGNVTSFRAYIKRRELGPLCHFTPVRTVVALDQWRATIRRRKKPRPTGGSFMVMGSRRRREQYKSRMR